MQDSVGHCPKAAFLRSVMSRKDESIHRIGAAGRRLPLFGELTERSNFSGRKR